MQFTIHQATTDDAGAIAGLLMENAELHSTALPALIKSPDADGTLEFIQSMLGDVETQIWVAEVAGQVVGYVHFKRREEKRHPVLVPRTSVHIDTLVVHASYRRHGIGLALMQQVHAWAKEHAIDDIELHVYEFNAAAKGLYDKLGYQTVSRRMRRNQK